MANFWENFAEAMGWGKANHTRHLSDISEEERNKYRSENAEARGNANKKDEHSGFTIHNAKDSGEYWTTTGGDFNQDWNSDDKYETRVYDFTYVKPGSGEEMDSARPAYSHGKMLVRVPKTKEYRGLGSRYFNDEGGFQGDVGVYEAVLDNGQVLGAKELEDLIYANPYSEDSQRKISFTAFTPGKQSMSGTNAEKMRAFNEYKRMKGTNAYSDVYSRDPIWDRNWRRWRSN